MLERKDRRIVFWVVIGLMALAMAVAWIGGGLWGWGTTGYGMMGGWMWMPLVLVMVVMMVFMMGRGGHHGHGHGHGGHNALDVLDRRYAAGELSREEYQRMRDDLERRP